MHISHDITVTYLFKESTKPLYPVYVCVGGDFACICFGMGKILHGECFIRTQNQAQAGQNVVN